MTKQLFEALEALAMMWNQYCDGESGHLCMSAGEQAEEVLSKYNLLINTHAYGGDIDWDKLDEYRSQVEG